MANDQDPQLPLTPPGGGGTGPGASNVQPINIEDEMRHSYLDYAMSVIIGRALPDVRDGFKPVHRRVLYAMHEMGLQYNKKHNKCAKVVGQTMGQYHPHGDSAIYDTLVRMAQPFSLRYPLIDGQGNFGSVDGDPPAAMRYTEARLAKISEDILADLEKETVDFVPNFDQTREEPVVLPSRIPNLLVNGASGIAVGMATNIPPHNLREIVEAAILLIEKPDTTLKEIMKIVPRQLYHARQGRHRRDHEGPRKHHHHGNSVSGEQGAANRAHCRTGADQKTRRHFRRARRILARRNAHRYRAEARRRIAAHSQQSFQVHADAGIVRHDPALYRRRAAARTGLDRHDQAVHRAPHRRDPPAHDFRAEESRAARAHFARLPDRAGSPGQRDSNHPWFHQPRGGEGKPVQVLQRTGRHDHGKREVQKNRRREAGRPKVPRAGSAGDRSGWPRKRAGAQLRADRRHPRITTAPSDAAFHR